MLTVEPIKDAESVYAGGGLEFKLEVDNSVVVLGFADVPKDVCDLEIPETIIIGDKTYAVTEIDYEAFAGSKLISVVIPRSITSIGNSITSIAYNAFCGCKNLVSVVIPNSVTEINDDAFYCCKNLKAIVIPQDFDINIIPEELQDIIERI